MHKICIKCLVRLKHYVNLSVCIQQNFIYSRQNETSRIHIGLIFNFFSIYTSFHLYNVCVVVYILCEHNVYAIGVSKIYVDTCDEESMYYKRINLLILIILVNFIRVINLFFTKLKYVSHDKFQNNLLKMIKQIIK